MVPADRSGPLVAAVRRAAARAREHRRALHEIPELAFEERATSSYVAGRLADLGLSPRTGIAGTGVLAELPGSDGGRTILLRADMDGLPVEEPADHEPCSRHPGRMHACGHDAHMAILLGIAEGVAQAAAAGAPFPGRLLLLFQPAEETGGGAARVIREGVLDEHGVEAVLGLHAWSSLPAGTVLVPDGPVMASSDEFFAVFRGPGGHGAMPHAARDTVLALAEGIVALQGIVSRDVDPVAPAVVTVGRVAAGTAPNVLPPVAELAGTARAGEPGTRTVLRERIPRVLEAAAAARDVRVEVSFGHGNPPVVNDPLVAARVREAAALVPGVERVLTGPMTMAAEDFGLYLERRPGAFCLLGMGDPARGTDRPHHSPGFRVNDAVLGPGMELLLRSALLLAGESSLTRPRGS